MSLLTNTWTDDDGSGSVGTLINNAQLQTIYQNLAHMAASVAGGRLTLTSGSPVTTADVTGASAQTVYYTPYVGDVILLYDGSSVWNPISFAETSIAVPATTATMYDLFAYNNAGTLALETQAWTSDSARNVALAYQNGVLVKSGTTTRRYLGSFRTTGSSGQTEDSVLKRYVWNYYNRIRRQLLRQESTASWNYSTATIRQANGSASNQVEAVIGVAEALLDVVVTASARLVGGFTTSIAVGVGEDSTTTFSASGIGGCAQAQPDATVNGGEMVSALLRKYPAIGKHVYSWNEWAQASGSTVTWYGAPGAVNGPANCPNGLAGWIDG